MANANKLITEHIDVWTNAIKKRNSQGRGSNKKIELTGIKKLRELILDLAVRGKLVPQDSKDEPASVLLEKMYKERAQLLIDKLIKKPKKLPGITNEEKTIPLPRGWEFVRLNDIGEWGAGATPRRGHSELYGGDIPWFKSGELSSDYIDTSYETVTELALKQSSLRYNKVGDVLLAMYGATIGKTSILKVRATTNQAVCACTPFNGLSNNFLLTLFKAYRPKLIGMGAGGAQPNISREKIIATVITLPPLEEQHRIVAKVDELMLLCDDLEQQTEDSISAHQTLVEVLLATLTNSIQNNSDTVDGFQQNWQRIADNFDVLFTTEDSIEQLKQTVLQLAVMGKLVPQNLSDEPASVLLKKMDEEKELLIASKKIKKQKQLPELIEAKQSYILPSGWAYSYMQDICSLITDGTHQTPVYSENGRPFVSAQCVKPFVFIPDKCRYVSEEHYQGYIKNRKPVKGDVLLARVGAGIGEAAVIDIDLEFAIYVSTGLLKPYRIGISPDFLVVWLNSPVGRLFSETNTLGKGVSQGNLNLSLIRQFIVGIPPLSEQLRIVAKVNELMVMCEQLKTSLNEVQIIQLKFADTIVAQAVK
jgi:type I restriction enzyme S subunit